VLLDVELLLLCRRWFIDTIRVWQHAQIYVESHARRHFEPYFGPLICIYDESRFKMAARVLQCKFHTLPDAYVLFLSIADHIFLIGMIFLDYR
jgi:hypothetical protein